MATSKDAAKHKAYMKKYNQSLKAHTGRQIYEDSIKGKATRARYKEVKNGQ